MFEDPGPCILNVDDDEASRYAITRVLRFHNFRVTEAASGAEALYRCSEVHPDLVLLDVNLPDIDGFEICRRLKADPLTSGIPVLHITASYGNASDVARGLEGGAESYLVEPVDPDVLVATVKAVLRARQAEDSANRAARDWQTTIDAISDGLALLDRHGRILRCNAALGRLLGRDPSTLPGVRLDSVRSSMEQPLLRRALAWKRREQLEVQQDDAVLQATIDPVPGEDGEPAGAVYILTDITERRQLEEQFRESQKFETIGTLAAGVAHDFNNLLTSILGNASLALSDEVSPRLRERLEEIVQASQRAADLTRQLLAYSGKGRHYVQRVNLAELIRGMISLLEASLPKKVRLEVQVPDRVPGIDADVNQLRQVVLNLVSNAAEAIGEAAGWIRVSVAAGPEPDTVALAVEDSGCGMSPEVQSRMFDPFFTTKFTGRGLGLSAVAGIARTHRARIEVTSFPGRGSRFTVVFPAVREKPVETAGRERVSGPATILVVDDEAMVRQVAQAALEVRGYRVVVAVNGREAVDQVAGHPEISIVLLDLTMPVMSGEEALEAMLRERPELKIVLSTGYDSREVAARLSHPAIVGWLQKPYTSRRLVEQIQEVLGERKTDGGAA